MARAATSVFLAGWAGFLAVSGAIGALAILRAAGIGITPLPWLGAIIDENAALLLERGNAEILATTVATLLQFMIAGFLALALFMVHSCDPADRAGGERFAMLGIGCVGALALLMRAGEFDLFDRFGTLTGFEIVVALSIAAVLFDRLIDVDENDDPADEANFRAAVALIGGQMARDAASRARPERDS